jgi:hypothetical protein
VTTPAPTVQASTGRTDAKFVRRVAVGLALGSVLVGVLAGELAQSGRPFAILGLAVVFLPILVWRKPEFGAVILLAAAAGIEQYPYTVGPTNGAFTDRIPLFRGLGNSAHLNLADLLLLTIFVIWLIKAAPAGLIQWPRSALSKSICVLMAAVALGVAVGLAHHGDFKTSFTEVRPYFYLAMTFLLTSVLVKTKEAIRAMLWALVVTCGFKAALGVKIFLSVRHLSPRPEAVLGHEDAWFFGVFIFLTVGLWLFEIKGALRTTATWLLPVVFLADLVNSRRTAWLLLGAGLIVLCAVGLACLPERRRFLVRLLIVTAAISVVYVPAYWNHTGTVAQPARAIRGFYRPDPRDASSNLYRKQENTNLKLNIKEAGPLGKGFGVPINYADPIADIKSVDPLISYIPHDGVLYIVMRMGVFGGAAFWSMIGIAIIMACRLARSRDRELALLGALVACSTVAYVLEGYNDQGFFFYRIAFAMGCLLGMLYTARVLDARRSQEDRPRSVSYGRPAEELAS